MVTKAEKYREKEIFLFAEHGTIARRGIGDMQNHIDGIKEALKHLGLGYRETTDLDLQNLRYFAIFLRVNLASSKFEFTHPQPKYYSTATSEEKTHFSLTNAPFTIQNLLGATRSFKAWRLPPDAKIEHLLEMIDDAIIATRKRGSYVPGMECEILLAVLETLEMQPFIREEPSLREKKCPLWK